MPSAHPDVRVVPIPDLSAWARAHGRRLVDNEYHGCNAPQLLRLMAREQGLDPSHYEYLMMTDLRVWVMRQLPSKYRGKPQIDWYG